MNKRILIPKDRLAVVIGKRGTVKRNIENKTNTKLTVDETIEIDGESLDVMTAENIVSAIARGFSPKNAYELAQEDKTLIIIELPREEKALRRVRSRLIGTKGKTRKNVEEYTRTKISIYGKTASIIGDFEYADFAKRALEKLIKGLTHKSVYKFLEEEKRNRKLLLETENEAKKQESGV